MTLTKVVIYCDGACLGNPGPGGYAALLIYQQHKTVERVVAGFENKSTNNRMELRAAIEGLRVLKRKCHVKVYSDSQYLVKGMKEWLQNWLKNNFRGANKKPITNQDLWEELSELKEMHEIEWNWVRGHAGNLHNERVDEIAREQALLAQHLQRKA
jgi:ribonuclease HI